MVILLNPYGQRSNNIFQHIHVDSFCRDNDIYFYNKFIHDMRNDYPNLKKGNIFINAISALKIPEVMNRLKITTYVNFKNKYDIELYKKEMLGNPIVYCNGWDFRSDETVVKYRDYYKYLFTPAVDEVALKAAFLQKTKPDEKIVGVHIRRGDYSIHKGGLYYYSDAVYLEYIRNALKLINCECRVLIFGNDDKLHQQFYQQNLNEVIFSNNPPLVDQYLMSKCDYLIGPPSTFSMWASYMGDVPLFHMDGVSQLLSKSDFRIAYSPDKSARISALGWSTDDELT